MSWEQLAITDLRAAIGGRTNVEPVSGMGALNRVSPAPWELKVMQQFQFGDLRYERKDVRVVVEVESGGGLTNLVKYWPMLGAELSDRRFVLAHLFKINSASDYVAHRRLWEFLVERMRTHLDTRGCRWGSDWTAEIFTYGHPSASAGIIQAADFVAHHIGTAS